MCGVIVRPHSRGRAMTAEAVPASETPPGPASRAGELGRQTETPAAGPGGVSDPLRQARLLADNPRARRRSMNYGATRSMASDAPATKRRHVCIRTSGLCSRKTRGIQLHVARQPD